MAHLYLDYNVADDLVHALIVLGHRARHTGVAASRDSDPQQLLTAARTKQILVTHNWKDFRLLHDAWLRWSAEWGVRALHPGILVVAQRPVSELARALSDFLRTHSQVENQLHRHTASAGWVQV